MLLESAIHGAWPELGSSNPPFMPDTTVGSSQPVDGYWHFQQSRS